MEITYQLFTDLQPPKRMISSIDTTKLHYFDLINIICQQERNQLGEELTIELYSCEGYPLASYPGAYIKPLSDWCLETYPDSPLLYAIPRPKIYTDKQTHKSFGKLPKGNDKIRFQGMSFTLKTDCSLGTYYQLLNSIQAITGIPTHLIQLKMNNKLILEFSPEDKLLSDLNIPIKSDCVIEITTLEEFWSPLWCNNFSFLQYHPTWNNKQTVYGTSQFFSCLYSISDWLFENKGMGDDLYLNTLGHLRNITGCPPLIHSLFLLFSKQNITLPHLVAITEMIVHLFICSKPKQYKEKDFKGAVIPDNQVTEYSNIFWTYFMSAAEVNHGTTEQFKTTCLIGHLSNTKMKDPVTVRNPSGSIRIMDSRDFKGTVDRSKNNLEYKRLTTSFVSDEAFVWQVVPMHPCGIDLTLEWDKLKIDFQKFPPLCIQAPLQVKSYECNPPSMIPVGSEEVGVYIGNAKDGSRNYDYFDVLRGEKKVFDAEELDKTLKINPPKCLNVLSKCTPRDGGNMGILTRDPEEVILVILDTSGSMEQVYLEEKTKQESVIEAFLAFSDRTSAYDLKHAIGLVLFTNKSSLQYPISENLKDFSSKFTSFPSEQLTAVYDAIKFAVQKLNEFDQRYPNYKLVTKRILCLTDGGDNASNISPEQATNILLKNNITMDTVTLCEELTYSHYIAKATGGYSFQPKTSQKLLAIFENEPMLSMLMRKHTKPVLTPCDDSDPKLTQNIPDGMPSISIPSLQIQLSGAYFMQFLLPPIADRDGWLTNEISPDFDDIIDHVLPDKLHKPVITMHKCLTFAMRQKHLGNIVYNVTHTKRLLQELAHYATNPHESFEIFPCEESIDFWQLILVGPNLTCYEGGIFHLYIEFTDKYPAKPPNIRFITPIYHCNINEAGKVCHSILDRFYGPGIRIKDILNYVYGLLMDPAPDDPLDSVKASELRFNPDSYNRNARDYTTQHAKQYKTKIDLRMEILQENVTTCSENAPQVEYICPLTGELFIDPVCNNEGDTYEREAILAHLWSGCEYDPFSRLPLKETDLRPNLFVIKMVEQYNKDIGKEGKML